MYLSIRCWQGAEPVKKGHMHFDQFSLELEIDGENLIRDPGSFCYQPFPQIRREYRESINHFSPFNNFPRKDEKGIFSDISIEIASILYFNKDGFYANAISEEGKKIELCIKLTNKDLDIIFTKAGTEEFFKKIPFSPEYGIINDY